VQAVPGDTASSSGATEYSSSTDPKDWGRAISLALHTLENSAFPEAGHDALIGHDLTIHVARHGDGVQITVRLKGR